jgi:hypothetical protein
MQWQIESRNVIVDKIRIYMSFGGDHKKYQEIKQLNDN